MAAVGRHSLHSSYLQAPVPESLQSAHLLLARPLSRIGASSACVQCLVQTSDRCSPRTASQNCQSAQVLAANMSSSPSTSSQRSSRGTRYGSTNKTDARIPRGGEPPVKVVARRSKVRPRTAEPGIQDASWWKPGPNDVQGNESAPLLVTPGKAQESTAQILRQEAVVLFGYAVPAFMCADFYSFVTDS